MSVSHVTFAEARRRAHREAIRALERGADTTAVTGGLQRSVLKPACDAALDTYTETVRVAALARDAALRDAWLDYGDALADLPGSGE